MCGRKMGGIGSCAGDFLVEWAGLEVPPVVERAAFNKLGNLCLAAISPARRRPAAIRSQTKVSGFELSTTELGEKVRGLLLVEKTQTPDFRGF